MRTHPLYYYDKYIYTFPDGEEFLVMGSPSRLIKKEIKRDDKPTRNFYLESISDEIMLEPRDNLDLFKKLVEYYTTKRNCDPIKVNIYRWVGVKSAPHNINDPNVADDGYCLFFEGVTAAGSMKIKLSQGGVKTAGLVNSSQVKGICQFSFKLDSASKIQCLLDNADKEYAVITPRHTMYNDVVYETRRGNYRLSKFDYPTPELAIQHMNTNGVFTLDNPLAQGSFNPVNLEEWYLETYEFTNNPNDFAPGVTSTDDTEWHFYIVIKRETYITDCDENGNSVFPIGEGWQILGDECVNGQTRFFRTPIANVNLSTYTTTRKLNEILQLYFYTALTDCNSEIEDVIFHSDFLNYDSGLADVPFRIGNHINTTPYTKTAYNQPYADLYLDLVSNVKTASVSTYLGGTYIRADEKLLVFSLKTIEEILNVLNLQFRVSDLPNNKCLVRVEHRSFFELGAKTIIDYDDHHANAANKYDYTIGGEFKKTDIPISEIFEWHIESSKYFRGYPIEYSGSCSNKKTKSNKYSNISSDLAYIQYNNSIVREVANPDADEEGEPDTITMTIHSNGNEVGDKGFVLIAGYHNSATNRLSIYNNNHPMSFTQLIPCLYTYGRFWLEATINDEPIQFDSSLPVWKPTTKSVLLTTRLKLFCSFNGQWLIKHSTLLDLLPIGLGIIDKAEYEQTGYITLDLLYACKT